MQQHPEHDDGPAPRSRTKALITGLAIAAVVIIVIALHLTGVVGPGVH